MKAVKRSFTSLHITKNIVQMNVAVMQPIEKFVKNIMRNVRDFLEKRDPVQHGDVKICSVDITKLRYVRSVWLDKRQRIKMIY
jgi:hypothetical protein